MGFRDCRSERPSVGARRCRSERASLRGRPWLPQRGGAHGGTPLQLAQGEARKIRNSLGSGLLGKFADRLLHNSLRSIQRIFRFRGFASRLNHYQRHASITTRRIQRSDRSVFV